MYSIVRALIDRIKALFVSHAVVELEAELIAAGAERKAELLRQADRYEQEGLHGIAEHLRQQVATLSTGTPLASVLVATAHLQADQMAAIGPADPATPSVADPIPAPPKRSLPMRKKKEQIVTEISHALARHLRRVLGPFEPLKA